MQKEIFIIRVNDYFPELCELTIPSIQSYANQINAKLTIVTDRKFPSFPPTYEKLQIFELGKDNDFNILIDADMVVSKYAPDLTRICKPEEVLFQSMFKASDQFVLDHYFARDGRNIGIAGGLIVSTRYTHDLWTPLEFNFDEACKKSKRIHILDEYCLSRNLARFGLKFDGIGNFQHFIHVGNEGKDKNNTLLETKMILKNLEGCFPWEKN